MVLSCLRGKSNAEIGAEALIGEKSIADVAEVRIEIANEDVEISIMMKVANTIADTGQGQDQDLETDTLLIDRGPYMIIEGDIVMIAPTEGLTRLE